MNFESIYHYLYYLLNNNKGFTIQSESIDHPQLSKVHLVIDDKVPEKMKPLISKLEQEIWIEINDNFESCALAWFNGYTLTPKLLKKTEEIIFHSEYYAEDEALWEISSPVYYNCIKTVDKCIEGIFIKEMGLTELIYPISFATLSIEIEVEHSKLKKLDAKLNYLKKFDYDGIPAEEGWDLDLLNSNKKNIDLAIKKMVTSAVNETIIDYDDYNISLKVSNAYLDQGIIDYDNYRECAYGTIDIICIEEPILEFRLEPFEARITACLEQVCGELPYKGRFAYGSPKNKEWREKHKILYDFLKGYVLKNESFPKGTHKLDNPVSTINFDEF